MINSTFKAKSLVSSFLQLSEEFRTFYSDFEKIISKIENCIENRLEDVTPYPQSLY
jgi:hypothetical protein